MTTAVALLALADRVDREEWSRDLDALVWIAAMRSGGLLPWGEPREGATYDLEPGWPGIVRAGGTDAGARTSRHYTASLDSALTLVPDGCDIHMEVEAVHGGWCGYAWVTPGGSLVPLSEGDECYSRTQLCGTRDEARDRLPRALCAAALRARAAMMEA